MSFSKADCCIPQTILPEPVGCAGSVELPALSICCHSVCTQPLKSVDRCGDMVCVQLYESDVPLSRVSTLYTNSGYLYIWLLQSSMLVHVWHSGLAQPVPTLHLMKIFAVL